MRIAICDDARVFQDQLREILFTYKAQRRLQIDVDLYSSGETLLASGRRYDMLFLDYQMPGINGMEVARELRRRSLTCSIVFVTAYPAFVYEAFEVQPYRFLPKPITPAQIEALLTEYLQEQKKFAPITVLVEDEFISIPSQDILYLEGDGKYCIVRTLDATYRSSKTLAQVHALLPQHCFFRCHKSHVVNLYSIEAYGRDTLTLSNGECARIGHSRIGEFKRVYKQFLKDYYIKI